MAKVTLAVAFAVIGCIVAEPPVGRQYLPPALRSGGSIFQSQLARRYGVPSTRYGAPTPFSRSSAAPFNSRFNARLNNLGSISTQYGVPTGLATAAPFNTYNARAITSGPLAGPAFLSSQYGAPAVSSRFAGENSLSSQYGAPTASSRFGNVNDLSTLYGAPAAARAGPSNTYGAPADFSRNYPAAQYGAPLAGYSAQEDPLAEPANYQFSYAVQDAESGSEFGQEETRQLETAQGSYRVLLPDGRLQVVEYQADEEGYKPEVRYEETELSRNAGGPYPASRALHGPY